MRIGVIGLGMVGEAVAFGMRRVGHEVAGYDKDISKGGVPFEGILNTQLTFVCVPTPVAETGECNTKIVWEVVTQLNTAGYKGMIVIKSTVTPGTTEQLHNVFPDMLLAFCPEFLRERARFSDFVENHELCVAGVFETGGTWPTAKEAANLIFEAHGHLPKNTAVMTPTEAELLKYFVNCFNAYRVNFANAFYDVCKTLGADYDTIKDAVTKRSGIPPDYLTCNEQTREFGGACLPKDTMAFSKFVDSLGLATRVFMMTAVENDRVRRGIISVEDVLNGLRKESAA